MADGILGLGSEGSASLSQTLIDDLKAKEYEATVTPIETDLEELEEEIALIDEIEAKALELLAVMEPFDLYTTDTNVFDEVSASTTGDSVVFDATDTSTLTEGTTSVSITQLAQKDVYQSNKYSDDTDSVMSTGQGDDDKLTIEVDGSTYEFATKDKTYEELVSEINTYTSGKLVASLEDVSDSEFRIVIKTTGTGLENAMNITQSSGLDLGFDDTDNHTLHAQNMLANVDGIDYDVSSNSITTQGGLTITGVALGDSTVTVQKDTSYALDAIYSMATLYNELVDLTNTAVLEEDSPIEDKSSIRTMISSIKEILFNTYGLENEESLFAYGISFDIDGYMDIDSDELSNALNDNFDDVKELFTGYAEKEGIGTQLKTYLDSLDGYDGLITAYEENMDERQTTLEEDKETAIERLDEKYAQMSQEFADATVAITQMESEFASLLAIIESE